jgi:outer membrane lipoprotein-sorting protein
MRSTISTIALLGALAVASPSFAQTAEQIVAMNLAAKGGAEKWNSVSSVKMTGKLTAQGRDVAMTVYTKRPNLMRQDIVTPKGTVVQGFDGTTPWMLAPGADIPREITGPQAEAARSGADFDGPLIDYASKGHKVELLGKEKVGERDTYHLKLTKKDGNVERYYIDALSGLEVKRIAEMGSGGAKQALESELSNYKSVEGMMIPHTIKQSVNGMAVMEMTLEKVELNAPMNDDLFRMSKK